MHLRNNSSRYGALALAAHWITAFLVVASWLLGTYGDLLPRGTPGEVGLMVHMCMGLTVLMISLPRLAWRLIDQQPIRERTHLGVWGERASTIVHYALYALLFTVPIFGILTQFMRGHPVPIFGMFEIASPLSAIEALPDP
jgi:cytochrome b561